MRSAGGLDAEALGRARRLRPRSSRRRPASSTSRRAWLEGRTPGFESRAIGAERGPATPACCWWPNSMRASCSRSSLKRPCALSRRRHDDRLASRSLRDGRAARAFLAPSRRKSPPRGVRTTAQSGISVRPSAASVREHRRMILLRQRLRHDLPDGLRLGMTAMQGHGSPGVWITEQLGACWPDRTRFALELGVDVRAGCLLGRHVARPQTWKALLRRKCHVVACGRLGVRDIRLVDRTSG